MGRRLKIIGIIAFLLLLPVLGWAQETDTASVSHEIQNPALDKGLRNNAAYSYSLANQAAEAKTKQEKISLLKKALEQSPDIPAFYFKLSLASLPNVFESISLYFKGISTYRNNFIWAFSLAGYFYVSIMAALIISLFLIAFVMLIKHMPLITHDINEKKIKILLPLILIGLSVLSPLNAIAGVLILTGLYTRKTGKIVTYIAALLIISSPVTVKFTNTIFSASTPAFRAITAANQGIDNTLAIKILEGNDTFKARFTYAMALKKEGHTEKAIAIYNELIETAPEPRLYTNLGNAYVYAGDKGRAREIYQQSQKLKNEPTVTYNLSQVTRDALDFETGDKLYDEALRMDPDLVSRYTAITSQHPNRFVIDHTLSHRELWALAYESAHDVISISHFSPLLSAEIGLLLLIIFIVLNLSTTNRSSRCSDCGKVICPVCTEEHKWGSRCAECDKLNKEDTSPQARVRRMLMVNEQKDKLRGRIKLISFTLPGLAYAYSGMVLTGFFFLWATLSSILLAALNPLFSSGLGSYGHGWLYIPAVLIIIVTYVTAFISIGRRLERGWP